MSTPPKRSRKKARDVEEPFGERLARLRRAAGYTQRSLAAELGISHRMVAYYESQANRAPAHLLPELAKAIAVTVDELLGVREVTARGKPQNQRLMRQLRKVEKLSPRARRSVLDHIQALWNQEHGSGSSR